MSHEYKEAKTGCSGVLIFIFFVLACVIIYRTKFDWASIVAFAGAAGTVCAAIATWRAAKKAAESAQIARESMEHTVELGKKTLKETQTTNRHTAFENRYAMLLAQHDNYHNQLCAYLNTGKISKSEYEQIKLIKGRMPTDKEKSQQEIYDFFHTSIHQPELDHCLAFLTGHEIISRYMRTLYHLLKFVHRECVFRGANNFEFQKNYTSPVRSTIRNDVLLLIAVNALNVRSQRAKESSYPYYQQLLHTYDFFEHAIFMFPDKPNDLFVIDDWVGGLRKQILSRQSDFNQKMHNQRAMKTRSFIVPGVQFISPLMMTILIFKNPLYESAGEALASLPEQYDMKALVEEEITGAMVQFRDAREAITKVSTFEFKADERATWLPAIEEILADIKKYAFSEFLQYDNTTFSFKSDENIFKIRGDNLRMHFRNLARYDAISKLLEEHNGLEGYMRYLKEEYSGNLKNFLEEVSTYKTGPVGESFRDAT